MTNSLPYKKWLIKNDISRPHLSGRWRLLWRGMQTINIPGHILSVGGFCEEKPTKKEYNYFGKWSNSLELQYKRNLFGFLKYSFSKRHLIKDGQIKARKIATFVHQALVEFANGNEDGGKKAIHDAWCEYMIIMHVSSLPLVDKGMTKLRQEETLKKVQPQGTEAYKKKTKDKRESLTKAVKDYIDNHPNALVLKNDGLLKFLQDKKLTYGYKDKTIFEYAKPFFRDKRKVLKTKIK